MKKKITEKAIKAWSRHSINKLPVHTIESFEAEIKRRCKDGKDCQPGEYYLDYEGVIAVAIAAANSIRNIYANSKSPGGRDVRERAGKFVNQVVRAAFDHITHRPKYLPKK